MNKEQLKELVKQHFNLVDKTPISEKFGEIFDENKAFKIVFPGDELKVGDKVKVVTVEGQESDAPDGFHKLEDGRVIKTENSIVTEINEPETEVAEEEMAALESISEVQGTAPQNTVTETNVPVSQLTGPVDTVEEVFKKVMMEFEPTGSIGDLLAQRIADAVAAVTDPMIAEMAKMKTKLEEMAKAPAASKTMAATSKTKMEKFSTATNDAVLNAIRDNFNKNKNK